MQAPGFWDDQERARKTSAAHASANRKLESFQKLQADAADLDELAEMAAEDEEMAQELGGQLRSVEQRLGELEEARLFSGAYDAGDAVVTVNVASRLEALTREMEAAVVVSQAVIEEVHATGALELLAGLEPLPARQLRGREGWIRVWRIPRRRAPAPTAAPAAAIGKG